MDELPAGSEKLPQVLDRKGNTIRQQVVDEFEDHPIFQISWGHHIQIFTKSQSTKEALFYVQKTIENGWSRAVLMNFMAADLFAAQGQALTNFSRLLPEPQSDLANENPPRQWYGHQRQPGGNAMRGFEAFIPTPVAAFTPYTEHGLTVVTHPCTAPPGLRSQDLRIKSPLLYQLS